MKKAFSTLACQALGYKEVAKLALQEGIYAFEVRLHKENRFFDLPIEEVPGAMAYLESLGIENMESTYYEEYNNVLCVNFAYKDGDVICYTDLIKVSVALDNGEIMGFDGRGFIVNHYDRNIPEPSIPQTEAQQKLSPFLRVSGSKLALIPTDATDEKLCWEFKCGTDDDETILVYINAETGAEEDILILLITDSGTLTI